MIECEFFSTILLYFGESYVWGFLRFRLLTT
uniref:Uncharacterized protein n=2 Tax=unclassified Caudoviricetes TaxID=2788787 RepID=A0A8S5PNJ1_9CAUD|nr:MAG TPA: hypothetical protein [Siphoviridae sp. ctR0j7]DAE07993.1 MAG TPA: hypothetical protein [Siphoviridae sp. ctbLB3]DAW75235.1 MAG TPA: hypothetical protein [Caudoviricetes sp.]